MVVEIIVDQKIKKKLYFNEVNDFWLNLGLSCFPENVIEELKKVIVACTGNGRREDTIVIDGISYHVKISTRNGVIPEHCEHRLPEEIEKEFMDKNLKSLIVYNCGAY